MKRGVKGEGENLPHHDRCTFLGTFERIFDGVANSKVLTYWGHFCCKLKLDRKFSIGVVTMIMKKIRSQMKH